MADWTERSDANYLGRLIHIGDDSTPFLSMMGGLGAGKTTRSFNYPVAQPWSSRAGDQSTAIKSEDTSVTTDTPITVTRTQDYGTCQIMKYPYGVSFAKQSTVGEFAGIQIEGVQPVTDELGFQRSAALLQMAIDLEFSYFQGVYVANSAGDTIAKMGGLEDIIDTNTVAASAALFSKELLDELLVEMVGNGAIVKNMVLFCNAFQKTQVSDVYGYAPESRNVGGVNVEQIYTDFGLIGVKYASQMPTDDIYIVEMSVCSPVFCPYKGQIITDVEVGVIGAMESGFLYTQAGFDYGPEEYHGSITGLATSK